jgi:ATP-dependent DNA helicase RecG
MRPSLLNPLFAAVSTLPGIGPKTAKLFDRLLADGGPSRLVDVLFHLPQSGIDRSRHTTIAAAPIGEVVTFEARVVEHRAPGRNSKAPLRVLVADDTGDVLLIYFGSNTQWVERALPLGETRWISGKIELYDGYRQMVHPDRVLTAEDLAKLPPVEPVYGLTEGLYQRNVQKAVEATLERLPDLPEWLDDRALALRQMPPFKAALTALHQPRALTSLEPASPARVRLALDELLASQLALAMMREQFRDQKGRASTGDGRISDSIERALPFTLTGSQREALGEIRADMASDKRMLRLLQGDVGSGKTLVALLAMATAVEAGRQAAMMAPTEILARQHYERMMPLCDSVGLRLALITGRDKAGERNRTLKALAAGEIDILVGTHALFQEAVQFRDLALAVVDEQHRFGVHQRLALGEKGESVDVLVMTATPIPRTLVLTYFGDMDVSTLREKPAGRQPIDTRAMPVEKIGEVVDGLKRAIAAGAQVYWVCPLVAENEELDLAAAEDRFDDLQRIFGAGTVGLVHGQMKGRDKDAAMEAFQRKETQVLVATTVIEVGVDVPNATIMVIEHAERFGLAQLHQLRGRVGRGTGKSTCLLLYKGPLGEVSKARIAIMRETEDGFRIAEEDLRLRGEGEILGTRQSGTPGFRLADLSVHAGLLPLARDMAQRIVKDDPALDSAQGQALRLLLYIFEREEAVRLLRAG